MPGTFKEGGGQGTDQVHSGADLWAWDYVIISEIILLGRVPHLPSPLSKDRPASFLVCSWQLLFECTCPQGHSSPSVAQSGSILARTQQLTMHPALIGCRQTVANCDPPRSFGPDTVHIQATLSLKLLELNVSI